MNLAALRTAVDRRTGIAYDPAATTEVLNEALQEYATAHRWPWLQTTWQPTMIAGRAAYTPPYGFTAIRSVSMNGQNLNRSHIGTIDGDTNWNGYAIEADQLVLSPVPGGGETVVVRITQTETTLSQDQDTPMLPEEWHQGVLVNLAASIILERLDELQRADRRQKAYEAAVRRMLRTARRGAGPIAARVRAGSGI